MTNTQTSGSPGDLNQERVDIIETLRTERNFLRRTIQGLDDEDAARCTTVSELCLGGIIKHVAEVEESWVRFVLEGPSAMAAFDEAAMAAHAASFSMLEGETLAGLLAHYEAVAARTDELVATIPSLDRSQPLPQAPWFPPNAVEVSPTGLHAHRGRDGAARGHTWTSCAKRWTVRRPWVEVRRRVPGLRREEP